MKKIFLLFALIISCSSAKSFGATCTTLSGSINQTTFQNTANACGSGNVVAFAANSVVTLTTQASMPCGVSLAGPVVPYTEFNPGDGYFRLIRKPVVKITGTIPGRNQALAFAPCTVSISITGIEWDGQQPSTFGGSFAYFPGNQQNVTFIADYLHGNQTIGTVCCTDSGDTLIYFDGDQPGTNTQNITITDNMFGATGDCSNIMQNISGGTGYQGSDAGSVGGGCAALGFHTGMTNINILRNDVYFQEQGFKMYEGSSNNQTSYCDTCNISNNDFSNIHRIGFETQINPALNGGGNMEVVNNSYHDNYYGFYGQFGLSLANNVLTETDALANLLIANNPPVGAYIAMAIETWGNGSKVTNNIIQGSWANGDEYNYLGNFTMIGNQFCGAGSPGSGMEYWNMGKAAGAPQPTFSGNTPVAANASGTTGSTLCTALTSVTPSISPASGSVSFPLTVTLNDSGNNTGIWYTTDGSNPVPGTGTAQYIASGGTIILTAAGSVKATGMWGSINQPASYLAGYGYIPSTIVTANYTGSGTPTVATPVLTPGSQSFTSSPLSVSIATSTPGASIHYTTDGTTPTPSSTLYTGPLFITATTTVQAIGVLSGNANSAIGSATYTFITPTLQSGFLGAPNDQNTAVVGQTIQFTAFGSYNNSPPFLPLPDAFGNTATWTTSNNAICTVNSSGLMTAVGVGTCNIQVTSQPTGIHFSPWTVTISAKALVSIALSTTGNISNLTTGLTNQLIATGTYNDSSTADITSAINTWTTGNANATITGTGLVTAVTPGAASFTATQGTITSPAFPLTITSSVVLENITVTSADNVNVMHLGWTLAFTATCNYSNMDHLNCTTTDSHGSLASWTSSNTALATFSSNILTEIGAGSGFVNANVGAVVSPNFNMTYMSALPMIFNLTGATVSISGSTVSISYK